MNEITFEAILVKNIDAYQKLPGFDRHAFYSNSPETVKEFGDAVYFVDIEWRKKADRVIYGS